MAESTFQIAGSNWFNVNVAYKKSWYVVAANRRDPYYVAGTNVLTDAPGN